MRARYAAALIALIKLAVHIVWLRPYGFFRDELYYIVCSDHLALGYVDQPPLCVAVLRAWRVVFGDSLTALRMLPAIVGALTVLVTGLLAMRLGGGTLAVVLAELAVLVAGQYLHTAHYYSMNVFDQLFWVVAAYLVARAVEPRKGESVSRAWVLVGLALGFGLMNKISVLWLGAGLFVGLVATPARDVLRTRHPYLAGLIAAALFAPYVAWEVRHGWPTLEFMSNALKNKYVASPLGDRLREQINDNNPFTLPIWLAGLAALLFRKLGARVAVLGWIYLVVFVIVMGQFGGTRCG
jgi:4-amino-4-deoxy-L-arabinose transferase-like glycosyltransferase